MTMFCDNIFVSSRSSCKLSVLFAVDGVDGMLDEVDCVLLWFVVVIAVGVWCLDGDVCDDCRFCVVMTVVFLLFFTNLITIFLSVHASPISAVVAMNIQMAPVMAAALHSVSKLLVCVDDVVGVAFDVVSFGFPKNCSHKLNIGLLIKNSKIVPIPILVCCLVA